MKNAFTLTTEGLEPGIALVEGSVILGEKGRGRSLAQWTPPPGSSIEGDRLVAVPEHDFLVAVRVPHGFRGSATPCWVVGTKPCLDRGKQFRSTVPFTRCSMCGTPWTTHGEVQIHPAGGWIPRLVIIRDGDPAVLDHGWKADGDAGLMASSPEVLLSVAPGAILAVERTGRVYGGPQYVGIDFRGNTPAFVAGRSLAEFKVALGLDGPPPPPIVVTRHPALVEYLREQGLVEGDVEVLAHVTDVEQVAGRRVIGVLPLHLAAAAETVTEVVLDIPADLRGQELDLQQLKQYAKGVRTFTVRAS